MSVVSWLRRDTILLYTRPHLAMATRHRYMTSEELALNPIPNKRTELVRGRLVVREPATLRHGVIVVRIVLEIGTYLEANPIGEVMAGDPGFTLFRNPDTVRAPDVAYLRADRMPTVEVVGFDDLAPDLAVEVLSPGDRAGKVREKTDDWLRAGTLLVWIIDPRQRIAWVHRADGTVSQRTEHDLLDGEDVLPGFVLSLARVLAP
jgi:Uma2 family endonuclease